MGEICTICGEEMSDKIIKLSDEWETETDVCSCELLKYVAKLEDEIKALKEREKDG